MLKCRAVMMHAFVLSVVALFANEVHAARLRVTPLFTVSYPPPPIALSDDGGLAFSDRYVFFGTDGGVFRAPLPMGKSTQPVHLAFASTSVTGLQFREGTLYAILDGMGHSLLKSTDDGVSWTPIDQALEECAFGHCEFLSASQLELVGDRIFVNAGGNVLVSGDEGASWNVLFGATSNGKPQAQACYDPAFAIIGERLLIGGECPLDVAYLRTGTLRPDLLEWEQEPELAATPFLENRNVQFIRRRGESNVVYAGIEGALMRSGDAGASYDFVLHYEGQAPKYPYITHILLPSQHRSAILIGGFDKANGGPFLSMSTDNGATWTDQSDLLPGAGHFAWSVTAMEETPNGQLVIAVEDDEAGALHLFEVHVPARRRAVRH